MPPKKRKKTASEMTDKELLARVFPKRALAELKKIAHAADRPKRSKKKA